MSMLVFKLVLCSFLAVIVVGLLGCLLLWDEGNRP